MITFARDVYDAIIEHAREGAPEEVCGVLGGSDDGDDRRVRVARRTENVADAPTARYALDPAGQLEAMESLEADGHDVVGFYHSHPQGPHQPSATDAAQATWPDASYVIVVLDGDYPYVGAWRWTGERFRQETVAVR